MKTPENKARQPANKARFTWRCWGCKRILMRLEHAPRGTIETKCKCGEHNVLTGTLSRGEVDGPPPNTVS